MVMVIYYNIYYKYKILKVHLKNAGYEPHT